MPGDMTMFRRNAVNYYGVFLKGFDKVDPYKDKLTIVRKNYYESGLQTQKRKFAEMGDDGKVYKYSYSLNEDTVLKWKVINTAGRVLERVPPQRDGDDYRVEIRDNFGKILKCIYFGPYHNWIKTKYYGENSSEPIAELVYWDKNGTVSILKYKDGADSKHPEVLCPCRPVEDQKLLQKLIDKLGVPEVSTLCSKGYVYFASDRYSRQWERYCGDPSLLDVAPYDPFPTSGSEPVKKIDLTQTDDVIVPEKAAKDSLIFDLDKKEDKLPPSRAWGTKTIEIEMPKLHSDALKEDDGKIGENKDEKKEEKKTELRSKNVFDLLYDNDNGSDDDDDDDEDELDAAPAR